MKLKTILLLPLFLFACNQYSVYSEFVKFSEDNHWASTEAKTFEFEITDETQTYDILFLFSHVYGYQFDHVPLHFSLKSPDGKTDDFSINLNLKDKNGKDTGDCSGDICDFTSVIREKMKFQKGLYKITVSHSFNGPYLPNVIGIGLEVDKAK
jgi:gliding motility-associated lipoprotein GldH